MSENAIVLKVTALVIRKHETEPEVLVFDHPLDEGGTMVQLPAGTIEPGEDPADAVLRELAEETGVAGRIIGLAGTLDEVWEGERRKRWVYLLEPSMPSEDSWPHQCDCGVPTICRWVDLTEATVVENQTSWLSIGRDWYNDDRPLL